jgi:hypothetical protein
MILVLLLSAMHNQIWSLASCNWVPVIIISYHITDGTERVSYMELKHGIWKLIYRLFYINYLGVAPLNASSNYYIYYRLALLIEEARGL